MSTLQTLAVTVSRTPLSLGDVLQFLHQRGRLQPLLYEVAAERLILTAAREAGLTIATDALQRAGDRFRYRHGLASAEQTHTWLAAQRLTVEDFEAVLERDLLVEKFKHHLSEPRLAAHFAAHRDRYAQAQLRQIVVASEEVARELLAQLTDEGRDFADLAREHSLHGPSRLTGGSLGLVPRYALPPTATEAIFAAKPSAVVGPVSTDQGIHLFLVEALPEPVLDDATAAVIRQELFDAWLKDKLQDVRIDLSWLQSS
jgi:parvulin-like peptidyl-prolyl isomerase